MSKYSFTLEKPVRDSLKGLNEPERRELETYLEGAALLYLVTKSQTFPEGITSTQSESFGALAQKAALIMQDAYLQFRAKRANLKHARQVLDSVPHIPPIPGDEWE